MKALAGELGINRTLLYVWKRKAAGQPYGSAAGGSQDCATSASGIWRPRCGSWKARWGGRRKLDFFGLPCADRGATSAEKQEWREGLYGEIRRRLEAQGEMSIEGMCQLAGVSRASFYRDWEQAAREPAEVALRDAIQRAAVKHRCYGYRRMQVLIERERFSGRRQEGAAADARR